MLAVFVYFVFVHVLVPAIGLELEREQGSRKGRMPACYFAKIAVVVVVIEENAWPCCCKSLKGEAT